MKFYDRQRELTELRVLFEQAAGQGRLTVLTGRRRVGKTALAREFAQDHKFLYLFTARKPEPLLCAEFMELIRAQFTTPVIGEIHTFAQVFRLLLELAKQERFTVIIDEFQEFLHINPGVYSEIQHLWDVNRHTVKLNLICIGSIYSLMTRLFEHEKEPLFGRADRIIRLKPFTLPTIREIQQDYGVTSSRSLFDLYLLTGGSPKYLELLVANSDLSLSGMLDFILQPDSPFLQEGKHLLIEEFGRDYGVYFSILELISIGKTTRPEIEALLEINVGGHLDRLENDFGLVAKFRPINAKPNARLLRWRVVDNFLGFWFRFIHRQRSALELGNYEYIRKIIDRDYSAYAGLILERCFHEIFAATGNFNRIGNYWERGNLNEIDLVAVNDAEKRLLLADIKLNRAKLSLPKLKQSAAGLLVLYPDYQVEWQTLSVEDISRLLLRAD